MNEAEKARIKILEELANPQLENIQHVVKCTQCCAEGKGESFEDVEPGKAEIIRGTIKRDYFPMGGFCLTPEQEARMPKPETHYTYRCGLGVKDCSVLRIYQALQIKPDSIFH